MLEISTQQIVLRLCAAAVLGSVVGAERERIDWAAGLRTHMLVTVGSCLLMIVSAFGFRDVIGNDHVALDPSRVAAQVVSGIGFLGAGTIILRREVVRGLTTAASLWTVAAIGLAVGGGLYVAAITTTVLVIVILALIKPLKQRLLGNKQGHFLDVAIDPQVSSLHAIESAVADNGGELRKITIQSGESPEQNHLHIRLFTMDSDNLANLLRQLRELPGVRTVNQMRL